MEILNIFGTETSPEQRIAICDLEMRIWPNPEFSRDDMLKQFEERNVTRPQRKHILILDDGILVAHAETFLRKLILEDGVSISVMALASVCTKPESRGRGFGRIVAVEALKRVDLHEFPVALFQTDVPGFYQKLGARIVQNRFVNRLNTWEPELSPWWCRDVMIYPKQAKWYPGIIDLNGFGY